ncbi:MAG TPA: hypothetical protein VIH76_15760 [Candidatus Acidoferrales bacterium]
MRLPTVSVVDASCREAVSHRSSLPPTQAGKFTSWLARLQMRRVWALGVVPDVRLFTSISG